MIILDECLMNILETNGMYYIHLHIVFIFYKHFGIYWNNFGMFVTDQILRSGINSEISSVGPD